RPRRGWSLLFRAIAALTQQKPVAKALGDQGFAICDLHPVKVAVAFLDGRRRVTGHRLQVAGYKLLVESLEIQKGNISGFGLRTSFRFRASAFEPGVTGLHQRGYFAPSARTFSFFSSKSARSDLRSLTNCFSSWAMASASPLSTALAISS